jgi:hypothetical protein
MGMYQTIEVFLGIKMSTEEAERIKGDYFNCGGEFSLFEFLIEAEPGKDAPVWFEVYYNDGNEDIVFGISTGYLFEVVDGCSAPGIEEVVFNDKTNRGTSLDLEFFLQSLGLKGQKIALYVVNSW